MYIWHIAYRYGNNLTIGLLHNRRWRLVIVSVLGQAVGQCFGGNVYPVTSNAGELTLLIGITWLVRLVQDDLALAGSFADFLHQSNLAFSSIEAANAARDQQLLNEAGPGIELSSVTMRPGAPPSAQLPNVPNSAENANSLIPPDRKPMDTMVGEALP